MSKPRINLALQRSQLDKRLSLLRKLNLSAPPSGWIRTLRTVMGMSATQLAKRLDVTPQTIKDYEDAEEAGTISLATLKKIAGVFDCEPQVVFLPRKSLEETIHKQALKAATSIVNQADTQMKMEAQGTSKNFNKDQIEELAADIARSMSRELWED